MSHNVYADMGFKDPDVWLQKASLVHAMQDTMKARGLTPAKAAKIVGMQAVIFRDILKGDFGDVDLTKLVDCLHRLGHDVHVEIKPLSTGATRPGTLAIEPKPLPRIA